MRIFISRSSLQKIHTTAEWFVLFCVFFCFLPASRLRSVSFSEKRRNRYDRIDTQQAKINFAFLLLFSTLIIDDMSSIVSLEIYFSNHYSSLIRDLNSRVYSNIPSSYHLSFSRIHR